MGLTIMSPHNGESVKIRDQDIGRAVKDREGRIFFVVPKSDGQGYYAALTRNGSAKDEARYLELEAKTGQAQENVREQHAEVFDATGPGRRGGRGKLVIVVLIIVVALVAYLFYSGKLGRWQSPPAPTPIESSDGAVPAPLPTPGDPAAPGTPAPMPQ